MIIRFFPVKRLHASTAKTLRPAEFFAVAEVDDHVNLWFEENGRPSVGYSISRTDLMAALEHAENHREQVTG